MTGTTGLLVCTVGLVSGLGGLVVGAGDFVGAGGAGAAADLLDDEGFL